MRRRASAVRCDSAGRAGALLSSARIIDPAFCGARREWRKLADIEQRRGPLGGAILFALLGLGLCDAVAASAACAPRSFDDAKFTVCAFDPRHDDIRLFLSGSDGKPYGSLAALAQALKAKGERLAFAMNAGMFKEDESPVGLYVENRQRLHEADTRAGATNFHLKPNGVFWIGDGVAGVTETSRYLAAPPAARDATQSGPMLVMDGKIHPKIKPGGASEKIRNGVGACDGGAVVFAISDEPVNFDTFARLFRDGLGCRNALFLDGSVSSLYAPELNRDDELAPIGPIVGIVRTGAAGSQ
ncbi:MAG TPA: phosphodiester glycosidase family protein [Roseiarcus sp.]